MSSMFFLLRRIQKILELHIYEDHHRNYYLLIVSSLLLWYEDIQRMQRDISIAQSWVQLWREFNKLVFSSFPEKQMQLQVQLEKRSIIWIYVSSVFSIFLPLTPKASVVGRIKGVFISSFVLSIYLRSHRICVHLAHVASAVIQLNMWNM